MAHEKSNRSLRQVRCPCCDGVRSAPWGRTANGCPRRRCRNCGRTFVQRPALLKGLHRPDLVLALAHQMRRGRIASVRQTAREFDVAHTTLWRWRLRILGATRSVHGPQRTVAALLTCRESRKGSREWVRSARNPSAVPPPRKRWHDYTAKTLPLRQPWQTGVVASAASGAIWVWAGPNARRSLGWPRERATPSCGTGNVAAHSFLSLFRGPATRYLHLYAAWYLWRLGRRGLEAPQHSLQTYVSSHQVRRQPTPNLNPLYRDRGACRPPPRPEGRAG